MRVADHKLNRSGANQPISRHPLFAVIVALWFGALFGVASLALPPALVERLVLTTGAAKVVPMMAPPLGSTARILIALGLTSLGAVIGFVIAGRIARPAPALRKPRAEKAANAEEAIVETPVEILPAEGAPPAFPGRRRSLIVQDSAPASDPIEPRILDVTDLDLAHFDAPDAPDHVSVAPAKPMAELDEQASDLAGARLFDAFARGLSVETEDDSRDEPELGALPQVDAIEEASEEPAWLAHEVRSTEPERPASLDAEPAPEAEAPTEPRSGVERILSAELDELSNMELLERLAIAMERRRDEQRLSRPAAVAAPAVTEPAEPEAEPEVAEIEASAEPEDSPDVEAPIAYVAPAVTPLTFAPLSIGPLEFDNEDEANEPTETEEATAVEAVEPVAEVEPAAEIESAEIEIQGSEAEEAEETPAAPALFSRPFVPAALRPLSLDSFDEDEDEGEPLPGYIPPRHIGLAAGHGMTPLTPAAESDEEGSDEEEDDLAEEEGEVLDRGYSSLLRLSRSATPRPPVVRIDEEEGAADFSPPSMLAIPSAPTTESGPFSAPVPARESAEDTVPTTPRLFDAPGHAEPQDTEKALRAALATLQRMSGAA